MIISFLQILDIVERLKSRYLEAQAHALCGQLTFALRDPFTESTIARDAPETDVVQHSAKDF